MRTLLAKGILILFSGILGAQAQHLTHEDSIKPEHTYLPDGAEFDQESPDIHSIKEFCNKGHVYGHFRNYFMATINRGELSDYWSNATGGALGYESAIWKGFQFGIKGIYTYQTFSADLTKIDSLTGKGASWEKELYDVTRPGEYRDLDRLEELFLRFYFNKKSFVEYGKIDLNEGPLLLRRDGRMKPFAYKGGWSEFLLKKQHLLKGGWIHGVSPRGMTEWFSIEEAIGLNNNGYQPEGDKAHYHEATPTRGIGIFNYTFTSNKNFKAQLWNYTFDRLMNITWFQTDFSYENFFGGLQYVHQRALPYQASLDYGSRYYQPDEQAHVISLQAGYNAGDLKLSAAYLHAFDTGRFLFPKELGRENFYVSQPRSWIDGFGDTDVYLLRMQWNPQQGHWKHFIGDLRLSYTQTPGPDAPQFNKYLASSRYQATALARYHFEKVFDGLEIMFLYVAAFSPDVAEMSPSQQFYKSHFHHLNFVTNIHF